jgi:hypothetical protein
MRFRTLSLLLVAALPFAGCSDTTGSGSSAEVEVVFVNRTLYVDAYPAFVFTVENRGRVSLESVRIDVDATRGGSTVASTVTTVNDLAPGEQAESEPAVLAQLDLHSDYQCYRYRVRAYDDRGETLSDTSFGEVCP